MTEKEQDQPIIGNNKNNNNEQKQDQQQQQQKEQIKKEKSNNNSIPTSIQPKPKLSKAERRELQEKQRADKASKQQQPISSSGKVAPVTLVKIPPPQQQQQKEQQSKTPIKQTQSQSQQITKTNTDILINNNTFANVNIIDTTNDISLVSHLPSYQDPYKLFHISATIRSLNNNIENLHPLIIKTGYLYANGTIRGANARCRAMLHCYIRLFNDFIPPSSSASNNNNNNDIRTIIDHNILKPAFQYWTEYCRPHSVSMGNAFTYLKNIVNTLTRDMIWNDILIILIDRILAYEHERIDYADLAIADITCTKIFYLNNIDDFNNSNNNTNTNNTNMNNTKDEVILTYGNSEAVRVVLQEAAKRTSSSPNNNNNNLKKIRVIVVDSSPLYEGKIMLKFLRTLNINCTYCLVSSITYLLKDVTKVVLGAASLSSDGSVFGRIGTAVIAMLSHQQHIPVLICSETYKISNRVFTESITNNEISNPNDILLLNNNNMDNNNVKRLNLLYDLTPAEFVSGIVTELGIVPPTSIAVLLLEMNPQDIKSYT